MSDPTVVSLFDQDPGRSQDLVLDAPAGWPAPPDPAAYHGLPGAIVEKIAPHSITILDVAAIPIFDVRQHKPTQALSSLRPPLG